jgi:hypothetical protein
MHYDAYRKANKFITVSNQEIQFLADLRAEILKASKIVDHFQSINSLLQNLPDFICRPLINNHACCIYITGLSVLFRQIFLTFYEN